MTTNTLLTNFTEPLSAADIAHADQLGAAATAARVIKEAVEAVERGVLADIDVVGVASHAALLQFGEWVSDNLSEYVTAGVRRVLAEREFEVRERHIGSSVTEWKRALTTSTYPYMYEVPSLTKRTVVSAVWQTLRNFEASGDPELTTWVAESVEFAATVFLEPFGNGSQLCGLAAAIDARSDLRNLSTDKWENLKGFPSAARTAVADTLSDLDDIVLAAGATGWFTVEYVGTFSRKLRTTDEHVDDLAGLDVEAARLAGIADNIKAHIAHARVLADSVEAASWLQRRSRARALCAELNALRR